MTILFLLSFFIVQQTTAQDIEIRENIYGEDDYTEDTHQSHSEELEWRRKNQVDINLSSLSDLEWLGLLSPGERQAILNYRAESGNFVSVYELQAVPGLTNEKIRLLLPYIQAHQTKFTLKDKRIPRLSDRDHVLIMRWKQKITSNEVSGDGSPFDLLIKYRFNKPGVMRFGVTLQQDPGEAFGVYPASLGFDHLSIFLYLKTDQDLLRHVYIGDYRLQLGQGLLSSASFGFNKGSQITRIARTGQMFRPHTSSSESDFFRGLAIESKLSKTLFLNSFVSNTKRDARIINRDGTNIITSLPASGYHRSTTEMANRKNTGHLILGQSLQHRWSGGKIGVQAIHHVFEIPVDTNSKLPRSPQKAFFSMSADYAFQAFNSYFFGELAISNSQAPAIVSGLIKSLGRDISISAIYRFYSPEYYALGSNGFGEYNGTQDEEGIYFGIDYNPGGVISAVLYTDFWKHRWPRFRVATAGEGREFSARINWQTKRSHLTYLQAKYELKKENSDLSGSFQRPVPMGLLRIRLHNIHAIGTAFKSRSRLELAVHTKEGRTQLGWLAYQDFAITTPESTIKCTVRSTYFDCPDFETRIFAYENDLTTEYSVPFLYGQGVRFNLKGSYKMSAQTRMEIKIAHTHFLDDKSASTDIKMLASFQF